MSHSPTLLMMQCHLWLFQPTRQVRPTGFHPGRLRARPNLLLSVPANAVGQCLPVNPRRNLCRLSPKHLPYPLSDPMPSPFSATSLEYSCSLCHLPLPNKNCPMPMPRPRLLPKTTPTYLPFRQSTTNFETCSVMPKPRNCPRTACTITLSSLWIPTPCRPLGLCIRLGRLSSSRP